MIPLALVEKRNEHEEGVKQSFAGPSENSRSLQRRELYLLFDPGFLWLLFSVGLEACGIIIFESIVGCGRTIDEVKGS
jgi:hypothetical protein